MSGDMLVAMYTTLSIFGVMVAVLTFAQWIAVTWRRVF